MKHNIGKRIDNVVIALLCLLTLSVTTGYAAPIIIDSFDQSAAQVVSVACDPPTLPNTNTDFLANPIILGGERDVTATIASCAAGSLTVLVGLGTDALAHGQLPAMMGGVEVVWDGSDGDPTTLDPIGLGGLDLTNATTNDGVHVRVLTADFAAQVALHVYTDATNHSVFVQPTTGGANEYFLPFSGFTTVSGAGADFTNVGAIAFVVDGTAAPALDMTVDLIQATTRDWGDLPAAYGLTRLADNGARHIAGSLFLGSSIDGETDGQESPLTDGDDASDGSDDENGIVPVNSGWSDGDGEIEVTVTGGAGCLWGWLDFTDGATAGADDSMDDSLGGISENILAGVPVVAGTQNITFPLPLGVADSQTFFARFRLVPDTGTVGDCSDDPAVGLTGEAFDGEVEDYRITFTPTAVTLQEATTRRTNPLVRQLLTAALLILAVTGIGLILYAE